MGKTYNAYTEFIVDETKALLSYDSPSGYGQEVTEYLLSEFAKMGVKAWRTVKGGVMADLETGDENDAILLEAHCDTLGAMVHEIKSDGRLKLTNIGGMQPNNAEAENVRIITRGGKSYEGTCQLINPSVHVNGEYGSTQRNWDTVEAVIDEDVKNADDVRSLGIRPGDYVCFDPRTRVTASGYIKSRFLDDKLSAAVLMGYAKYVKDNNIELKRRVYMHFTIYEEVGHGGAASCPAGVTEAWSVDMGCVGKGLTCTEHEVSIAAKDRGGPYNYDIVTKLIELSEKNNIGYAVDIYPFYGSDVEATLSAGNDIRHALIGPGVYASHGYERSHKDAVENTFNLIKAYMAAQ